MWVRAGHCLIEKQTLHQDVAQNVRIVVAVTKFSTPACWRCFQNTQSEAADSYVLLGEKLQGFKGDVLRQGMDFKREHKEKQEIWVGDFIP
jgi:hypothetical protein